MSPKVETEHLAKFLPRITKESSENPFREIATYQNGSARTRSDADAAHMRKAPGVMHMRQKRQMQIDEDACIRN